MISMRMPQEVLRDLKRVARVKEMSGYQALIKFYVGQGLRKDLAELRREDAAQKAKGILEKHKVDPKVIEEVVASVG
ncbi:MAG: hypothetical protein K9K66_17310 [Desulfarculaceae bacterium]|nr:hypothetical protein [Desulfarculaceae bacterium]MCF8071452.1 hypothetical protein [Desulfarculaceae bacterium]MCF8103420.1 hypothetical protein [Desulfarculaceae bacterium]MCF8117839.1 hypothetical protein [Desulfarculaceae bacterium]